MASSASHRSNASVDQGFHNAAEARLQAMLNEQQQHNARPLPGFDDDQLDFEMEMFDDNSAWQAAQGAQNHDNASFDSGSSEESEMVYDDEVEIVGERFGNGSAAVPAHAIIESIENGDDTYSPKAEQDEDDNNYSDHKLNCDCPECAYAANDQIEDNKHNDEGVEEEEHDGSSILESGSGTGWAAANNTKIASSITEHGVFKTILTTVTKLTRQERIDRYIDGIERVDLFQAVNLSQPEIRNDHQLLNRADHNRSNWTRPSHMSSETRCKSDCGHSGCKSWNKMSDRVSWAAESANHMPGAFHCTQTPTMHFVNGRYAGPDGVFHIIKTTFPDFSFEYRISFYLKSMESADVFGTGPRVVKPEIANGCHLLDHLDTSEGTVLTKSWRTDTICKSGCGHEECVEFTKTPLRRQSEELKAANVMEGRFHDNQVEIGKFKGGVPVSRNRLGNVEDDDVLGSRERKRASLM